MKHILIIIIVVMNYIAFAQCDFPYFLSGTWKIENKEMYEHWDSLGINAMRGFSYKMMNGQQEITEYLDINRLEDGTFYSASVLNQNQGKGIDFRLTKTDSAFVFENPDHDFPKKIVYQRLSDSQVFVQVSDGKQKEYDFKMNRLIHRTIMNDSSVLNPNYDAGMAEMLQADDYGMKSYILVILKTGSHQTSDKDLIMKSFRGHLDNINQLVALGKMIVAGPLNQNENNYRGIFILDVITEEEAGELLQSDPAIKIGLLDFDLYKWYGSAALPQYLEFSDKIWKVKP
jgi:uncharacterized protein YciI